jgi:hypothetical protein
MRRCRDAWLYSGSQSGIRDELAGVLWRRCSLTPQRSIDVMKQSTLTEGDLYDILKSATIMVGDGCGFVVQGKSRRYVITAAGCLPVLSSKKTSNVRGFSLVADRVLRAIADPGAIARPTPPDPTVLAWRLSLVFKGEEEISSATRPRSRLDY